MVRRRAEARLSVQAKNRKMMTQMIRAAKSESSLREVQIEIRIKSCVLRDRTVINLTLFAIL